MMSQTNKWRSCNEVCRKIRKSTQFRWERETANFREKNRPSTTVKFESSLLDSFSAQSWIRKQVIIYKPLFHLTCTRYNRWQEEKLIRVLLYLLKHKRAPSNLKLLFYLIFQDNTSCIFVNNLHHCISLCLAWWFIVVLVSIFELGIVLLEASCCRAVAFTHLLLTTRVPNDGSRSCGRETSTEKS